MALEARLDLPPAEAIRFFAAKGDTISWDHRDVWAARNVQTFTVAKATSLDVLATLRKEVERAIGEGQTFADFKRRLRPRLQELGWWGTQEVLDGDTGELTRVQLGSLRRLRTIYQTNVQTAYMAGRYMRYVDNAADRPYWRYVSVMDGRTRPEHAALHGKVWRWNDPIWQVLWPPNGWGCRCRIQALTEAEFRALGVELENGADAIVELQLPPGKDGAQVTVKGVRYRDAQGRDKVFRPDPGWDYNPGAEWARFDKAAGRPDGPPAPAAPAAPAAPSAPSAPSTSAASAAGGARRAGRADRTEGRAAGAVDAATVGSAAGPQAALPAAPGLPTWSSQGRPSLAEPGLPRLRAPALQPAAAGPQAALRNLQAALQLGRGGRLVTSPVEVLLLKPEMLHLGPPGSGAERYADFIIPTLQQPFEVWLTPYADGAYRKRYIGLFEGLADLLFVVRENRDGSLTWQAFDAVQAGVRNVNALRAGTLLFGRPWNKED